MKDIKYSGINRSSLFLNIAKVIKAASDTQMYSMITPKAFDAVGGNVPCDAIIEEAFRMYDEDGASDSEVATMIQQHYKV